MFSKIKALKRRFDRYYSMRSSEAYLNYLRKQGARIGDGTILWAQPMSIMIDPSRPWLIDIGKNVQITKDVKLLTHGYDWSALKAAYGEIDGSSGKIKIGDNCFIGMNAVILKGTTIGDNVIVGAGSVVTGGEYPSDCVIAGNPARVICTLDKYLEKRRKAQKAEAKELVLEYYKVYGKRPEKNVLSEFFWLFEERDNELHPAFKFQMSVMGNYDDSMKQYKKSKPEFNGYDAFLEYCFSDDTLNQN